MLSTLLLIRHCLLRSLSPLTIISSGHFDQSTQIEEPSKKLNVKYIVQGINDLVSETEECDSIDDVLSVLNEQAIISLFQIRVINRSNNEIIEIMKARDFLERYANS